jgi:hypothetical protein
MPRKTNYFQLYKTYQKRRAQLYSKDLPMKEQLSISNFAVTYEQMKKAYKDLGYKSPTKNIIQNLTRSEIDYDWSRSQAKNLKDYIVKNYNQKDFEIDLNKITIKDLRLQRVDGLDMKKVISDFNKTLKDKGYTSSKDRANIIKNTFFGSSL